MTERLQIWTCGIYRHEVQAVLQEKFSTEVDLHVIPQICRCAQLPAEVVENYNRLTSGQINPVVLLGNCLESGQPHAANSASAGSNFHNHCLYKIANRALVDFQVTQGAYVLTCGWLEEWRQHLAQWGFDQPTAREFFHEFSNKLLLLDTGINPASPDHLRDLSEYLDLPGAVLPVGLDFLELSLAQRISEWKRQVIQARNEAMKAEYNRQVADNAMALDLLTQLTRTLSEDDATEAILELFTMLFSPGAVAYCSVLDGKLNNRFDCNLDPVECQDLQNWALLETADYAWTASGQGFYLRLSHLDQTLGVLRLENLRLPQYKQQYLNLSLSIARLCGLVIFNTRLYGQLHQAEATARREKEKSESLRLVMTELASKLNLEEVLTQILKSLVRMTDFSSAAIFIFDESQQLQFKAGMYCAASGEIVPYSPSTQTILCDPGQLQDPTQGISDMNLSAELRQSVGGENIQAWLGVPLLLHHRVMGYLSIGSHERQAYGEEETALVRSFAAEASIAIENARQFLEIQKLAITDSLTGLNNRRHFFDLARKEFQRSVRYQDSLSVIMIDIDFYKRVNDTFGHAIGDYVLREVADSLKASIRGADIIGRYGGEEFVLLLPKTQLHQAELLAERLRAEVANLRIPSELGTVQVTISLGIAELSAGSESLDEVLRQSDRALSEAKKAGRNCFHSFVKGQIL